MAVKRKSNWYIYLIALIISFVLIGFFISTIWDTLFPASKDVQSSYTSSGSDFRPSADINMTSVIMLSDMKAATPAYYMLMNYRPRDEIIVFVPLQENMRVSYGGNTGSLYEMYDNFGAAAVMGGIENTLGIKCVHAVKLDRLSFIDLVDMTGKVYVNVPADITKLETKTELEKVILNIDGEDQEVTRQVTKNVETVIFAAGSQYYDGETLYDYITYNFGKGVDYSLAIHGSVAMNMVNKNFRNLKSTDLQNIAQKIINSTETDISFNDYIEMQSVLQYTTDNSINPCEYYMPYGEEEGGYFVIAENSRATILDRLGIAARENDESDTAV